MESHTVRFCAVNLRFLQVSVSGFQLILNSGEGAGERGMKRDNTRPAAEMAIADTATPATPQPGCVIIQPP